MKTFKNWADAQRGKDVRPIEGPKWKNIVIFIIGVLGVFVIFCSAIFAFNLTFKKDAPQPETITVSSGSGGSGGSLADVKDALKTELSEGAMFIYPTGDTKYYHCSSLTESTWVESAPWEVNVICGEHDKTQPYPKYEYTVETDVLTRDGVRIPDLSTCQMIYDPNITMVWDYFGKDYVKYDADGQIAETVRDLEDICQAWATEVKFAELPNSEQLRILDESPSAPKPWRETDLDVIPGVVAEDVIEIPVEFKVVDRSEVDLALIGLEPRVVVGGSSGDVLPVAQVGFASKQASFNEVSSAVREVEAVLSTAVTCPEGFNAYLDPTNGNCSVEHYVPGVNVPVPASGFATTVWTCPQSVNPMLDPTNGYCSTTVINGKPAPVVEASQTTAVTCPESINALKEPNNGNCSSFIAKGIVDVTAPSAGYRTTVWSCPESINAFIDPLNARCSVSTLAGK